MSPQPLRALLYARKSSYRRRDPRTLGRSVREQLEECRAWCQENNAVVVDEYVDDDRSASHFADKPREAFERLIDDIRAGRGDIVVTWESSRLQRDLAVYARLRDVCWRAGVLWCYNGRIYDLSKREDRLATAYDAIRDEDEAWLISERVQRALRANARSGRPHGRILYGYRPIYDLRTGQLATVEPDETPRVAIGSPCMTPRAFAPITWYTRAGIVRQMFRDLVSGRSIHAIIGDLNRRGVRPPRAEQWWRSAIRAICLNPGYIGRRYWRGEDMGAAMWPPLVDEATYWTARTMLEDPARVTRRDGRAKYLLSGIAECAVCHTPARVARGPGRYHCPRYGHFRVSVQRMDDYVQALLVSRLAAPDAAEIFTPDPDDARVAEERARIAHWRAELAKAEELVAEGKLSVERLAGLEQRLLPLIQEAEERVRAASTNPLLSQLLAPAPDEVWERWAALDLSQQRSVIRAVFARILVSPMGKGRWRRPVSEIVTVEWREG